MPWYSHGWSFLLFLVLRKHNSLYLTQSMCNHTTSAGSLGDVGEFSMELSSVLRSKTSIRSYECWVPSMYLITTSCRYRNLIEFGRIHNYARSEITIHPKHFPNELCSLHSRHSTTYSSRYLQFYRSLRSWEGMGFRVVGKYINDKQKKTKIGR